MICTVARARGGVVLTWGITVIHTPGATAGGREAQVGPTSGRGFGCEGPRCVTTSGHLCRAQSDAPSTQSHKTHMSCREAKAACDERSYP